MREGRALEAAAEDGGHPAALDVLLLPHIQVKLDFHNRQAVEKRTSLAIVQLIHRPTQADISCTTTARLFFFPLLDLLPYKKYQIVYYRVTMVV